LLHFDEIIDDVASKGMETVVLFELAFLYNLTGKGWISLCLDVCFLNRSDT